MEVDLPRDVYTDDFFVEVYDNGVAIVLSDKLPVSNYQVGDAFFCVSADGDITQIMIAGLTLEQREHTMALLLG